MTRGRLAADDAGAVARAYGLGRPTGPMRPAVRGELLPTATGPVALQDALSTTFG